MEIQIACPDALCWQRDYVKRILCMNNGSRREGEREKQREMGQTCRRTEGQANRENITFRWTCLQIGFRNAQRENKH